MHSLTPLYAQRVLKYAHGDSPKQDLTNTEKHLCGLTLISNR